MLRNVFQILNILNALECYIRMFLGVKQLSFNGKM
jgi:hypothetical protein